MDWSSQWVTRPPIEGTAKKKQHLKAQIWTQPETQQQAVLTSWKRSEPFICCQVSTGLLSSWKHWKAYHNHNHRDWKYGEAGQSMRMPELNWSPWKQSEEMPARAKRVHNHHQNHHHNHHHNYLLDLPKMLLFLGFPMILSKVSKNICYIWHKYCLLRISTIPRFVINIYLICHTYFLGLPWIFSWSAINICRFAKNICHWLGRQERDIAAALTGKFYFSSYLPSKSSSKLSW